MSHSYSETTNIICPGCRQEVSVEIWRIVDTQERPDLSDRIRKKEIHAVVCDNCGHKGRINAPLLINVPEREDLFFVRAEKTSEVENWRQTLRQQFYLQTDSAPCFQRLFPVRSRLTTACISYPAFFRRFHTACQDPCVFFRHQSAGFAEQGPL